MKVISFSLWGDKPMYNVGAIKNAQLAKKIYGPDWHCFFYVGTDVPQETINALDEMENTNVIIMDKHENNWQGMFWRFFAIDADEVDTVVFRDTDSRLSPREKYAVDDWMQSDKPLHIMRDHPYHNVAIPGGMWGVRPKSFMSLLIEKMTMVSHASFNDVINQWLSWENEGGVLTKQELMNKGVDQHFLEGIYHSCAFDGAFVHDSFPQYNCYSGRFDYQRNVRSKFEFSTGFPGPARHSILNGGAVDDWNNFVGQVFDENDVPVKEYADLLQERDECIYKNWSKE